MHSQRHPARIVTKRNPGPPPFVCEAEVVEGIEPFARDELLAFSGSRVKLASSGNELVCSGALPFEYTGNLRALFGLRTVSTLFLLRRYPVPRPRALLGHEHFHTMLSQIALVRELHLPGAFQTLHIDAAGSDSNVMRRLKSELALHTGLENDDSAGDLLIRIRRPPDGSEGWETLVRLTPRPLSTRQWRVRNMEGALNATVAHVMALLTWPQPDGVFVNLACGSGSILIERLACGPARHVIGCDNSGFALSCAAANIAASPHMGEIDLCMADARALPFPDGSVGALCADLPFGQLVGSHDHNATLYPQILRESHRVTIPGARLVILTHEIRLMGALLRSADTWFTENVIKITLRGLHPRIYVLRKP